MRDALTRLLFTAHPAVFGQDLPLERQGAVGVYGIEHEDGWFALTAALAAVIGAGAPGHRIIECKAKLSRYVARLDRPNPYGEGAVRAAAAVAQRVSERSGRRGRPMVQRPPFVRVLAPAETWGWSAASDEPDSPPIAEHLRKRHPARLAAATLDVPPACLDLADAWLGSLPEGVRLARLRFGASTEAIGPVADAVRGAVDFLAELARRTDHRTGNLGPVRDNGGLRLRAAPLPNRRAR